VRAYDAAFLLGLAIAVAGIAMLSVPVAMVVGGTLLSAASWAAYQARLRSAASTGRDDRA